MGGVDKSPPRPSGTPPPQGGEGTRAPSPPKLGGASRLRSGGVVMKNLFSYFPFSAKVLAIELVSFRVL